MGADGAVHFVARVAVSAGARAVARESARPSARLHCTTDGDGRVRVTRTSTDGKVLKEDQWSRERLVLDSALSSRLHDPLPTKASAETALQTAKIVRGKVATYYALEQPPIPTDPA